MPNLNRCTIIGNVGKSPEMRYSPSGSPITSFSVAVNSFYTTADGEKKQDTEWFSVITWRKLAETCNQFVTKGMSIYVEGQLKTHSWVDKEEIRRYKTELIARQVQFLNKTDKGELQPIGDEEIPLDTEPEDLPF